MKKLTIFFLSFFVLFVFIGCSSETTLVNDYADVELVNGDMFMLGDTIIVENSVGVIVGSQVIIINRLRVGGVISLSHEVASQIQ